jgi:hypothetical protein
MTPGINVSLVGLDLVVRCIRHVHSSFRLEDSMLASSLYASRSNQGVGRTSEPHAPTKKIRCDDESKRQEPKKTDLTNKTNAPPLDADDIS